MSQELNTKFLIETSQKIRDAKNSVDAELILGETLNSVSEHAFAFGFCVSASNWAGSFVNTLHLHLKSNWQLYKGKHLF